MTGQTRKDLSVLVFGAILFIGFPLVNFTFTLDPETLPRYIGLALLLFFFSVHYLKNKDKLRESDFPMMKNGAFISFFLYAFFSALKSSSTINLGDGIFDLMKIFLSLIFLVMIYLLFQKNEKRIEIIFKLLNISVWIFTFFGSVQIIDQWQTAIAFETKFRIGYNLNSTLGNKNIYSEVLFLCLPFLVYNVFSFSGFWKWFGIVNLIISIISIIVLRNVYVWVALSISVFAVLFLVFLQRKKLKMIFGESVKKLKVAIALIALSCILFVIIFLSFGKFSSFNSLKEKANTAIDYATRPETIDEGSVDRDNNNIHERILLIKNTLKMIKEHPNGVGLSNWKIFIPQYGVVSFAYHVRQEYPHNDFLCVLSETGPIGVLFYLLFFIFLLKYSFLIFTKSETPNGKFLGLLLFSGIIGFTIISFFGFSKEKFFPQILLMLMSALILIKYHQIVPSNKELPFRLKQITLILLLVICSFSIFVGCKRMNGEIHLQNAFKAQHMQIWEDVAKEVKKAYSPFYTIDFSGTPIDWYKGFAYYYLDKQNLALKYFLRAEKFNPYHIQVLNDIGTCYELRSDHKNAINYFEKAYRINPSYTRPNLIAAYFNSGKIEEAFDLCYSSDFSNKDFLAEIVLVKARKFAAAQNDETLKADLYERINDKEWLLEVFNKARTTKSKFESLLREEVKKHGKY